MHLRIGSVVTSCLLCLCVQVMEGKPTFSFKSVSVPGLELIPPRSDAFLAKVDNLVDPEVSADIQEVLPFSYILENHTEKQIICYSSVWTLTDAAGHVTTTSATWWNLSTLKGGDAIAPGESRLVSPIFRLGIKNFGPTGDALQRHLRRFASSFTTKEQVALSVDSIIFDDGKTFGPNLTNAAARAQAFLDAERAIADDPVSQLAAIARNGSSPRVFPPLSNPPTYQEALAYYRQQISGSLATYQQHISDSLAKRGTLDKATDSDDQLTLFRENVGRKRYLQIAQQN